MTTNQSASLDREQCISFLFAEKEAISEAMLQLFPDFSDLEARTLKRKP